jgi:hypothetical protein
VLDLRYNLCAGMLIKPLWSILQDGKAEQPPKAKEPPKPAKPAWNKVCVCWGGVERLKVWEREGVDMRGEGRMCGGLAWGSFVGWAAPDTNQRTQLHDDHDQAPAQLLASHKASSGYQFCCCCPCTPASSQRPWCNRALLCLWWRNGPGPG